jgi:hypothetical protein
MFPCPPLNLKHQLDPPAISVHTSSTDTKVRLSTDLDNDHTLSDKGQSQSLKLSEYHNPSADKIPL